MSRSPSGKPTDRKRRGPAVPSPEAIAEGLGLPDLVAEEVRSLIHLRVGQVADLLGVSSDTVRRWLRSGELSGLTLEGTGGRRSARVSLASVRALVARRATTAASTEAPKRRRDARGSITRERLRWEREQGLR
jgi:excisionase family DNA binding protein